VFSTGLLYAQTDFKPGYVIPSPGDTLFGKIDYRGDLLMKSICRFKTAENTIIEYTPKNILAFRFIDSKYYISREVNGESVFLEYLIKGRVNIYYLRDAHGDHYYINKDDTELTEIPYQEGIKYVDAKRVYFETKQHVGILKYYMQDAPELKSQINGIKRPVHQNLIKLAEDYHNAVCKGDRCIIYERVQPFVQINLEFDGGVVNFRNVEDLHDRFYFQGGIIAHLWMPRTNEKIYFRTGLLYSQLEFTGEKRNYYKIPCHIEYIYPKGILRPKLSYGLNLYYPFFQSISFNPGLNIKLIKPLYLSISSDIEFNPVLMILPHDLLSGSINIGIIFEL